MADPPEMASRGILGGSGVVESRVAALGFRVWGVGCRVQGCKSSSDTCDPI